MVARIAFIAFVQVAWITGSAQDRIRLVALETGINFIESESTNTERIRASSSGYYGDGFRQSDLEAQITRVYGGVKIERRSRNNFFALSTGLRVSRISNVMRKRYSGDHFYYLLRQTGTTTEYLRVRELQQVTSYISVPLEVRLFPYRERKFRLYFLAGTEVGFKVSSKGKVAFLDPSMELYEPEIAATIDEPGSFCATLYGRGGFIIGGEKPVLEIGITFPMTISGSASTLGDTGVGGGFHLQALRKF